MRSRMLMGGVAAALVLLATGCGGGAASGGADPAAVAWTDEVCGALTGFIKAVTDRPDVDPSDAVGAVRDVSGYLGSTTQQLQESLTALAAVGPSPVEGGDAYVARLRTALGGVLAGFEAAQTQLAAVDTSRPEAVATAVPAAVAPLQQLQNLPDPTEGLNADDEFRAAAEEAPGCRALRAVAAPAG
jgi:hypothetical protein